MNEQADREAATIDGLALALVTVSSVPVLLLDGALRFARQGREGLEKKDFEAVFNGFSQCRNIITELIVTMRPPSWRCGSTASVLW